mmetsp:Transcript_102440/g.181938  ORF Transcript_102440/g.181938 Transcript_102440/m.181938 type:complete len:208 (-) Transcript_102440:47-670(-)
MPKLRSRNSAWLLKLCALVFTSCCRDYLTTFLGALPIRGGRLPSARLAEGTNSDAVAVMDSEPSEEPPVSTEGTVSVVFGVRRYRVPWAQEESCSDLRLRIENLTEVPCEKQQLLMVDKSLLGEGIELQKQYEAAAVKTLWLTDMRTPEEKGVEEMSLLDKIKEFYFADPIQALGLAFAIFVLLRELLPALTNRLWSDPLADIPFDF